MADVWANSVACHPRATCHTAGCCHLANSVSWFQSYVSHCRVLPPSEFNGMSSRATYYIAGCCHLVISLSWFQSHMPHFMVQSPGESNATLQGVRILSAILKIVFRHILFFWFLMQFRLWWVAAFVSSPIHLLETVIYIMWLDLADLYLPVWAIAEHLIVTRLSPLGHVHLRCNVGLEEEEY